MNTQEYQILIVPKYNYIPKAAADGIAEFLKKGGQVFFVEDYPENCCEGMALPEEIRRGICLGTSGTASGTGKNGGAGSKDHTGKPETSLPSL